MKRFIFLLILLFLLIPKAQATEIMEEQSTLFGVEELEKGLPPSAEAYLDEVQPGGRSFTDSVLEIISDGIRKSGGYIHASVSLMMRLMVILLLCGLIQTGETPGVGRAVAMAGVLAMAVCCASDLRTMVGLGKNTMDEMMNFSTLLLPVMASAAAASGSLTGAGILYGIAVTFSKILVGVCGKVLFPVVYAYLALGVTDAALQETRLAKLQETLAWAIKWGLRTIMYLFTGFLGVSGILAGSVDATTLKTAKVTISGMVPVVGGIIADAAESVLYSAGVLKSAIGTFGMLAFLAVFILPFLQLGIHYLSFKLTTALAGILGSKLVGFMDCITSVMGFLLAMLGSCVLMCMLSCCCFLRVVGI